MELASDQTIKSDAEEKFPLKFNVANVDLGEAETHFEHSFSFRNDSEDTIDNIKLLSSCGCAKITMTPESVAPHQEGTVVLEIDQTGKGFGQQLYTGFVEYKVKDKYYLHHLNIKTNNGNGVSISPKQIDIDSYSDELPTRRISIVDTRRKPLKIQEITSSDSWLECKIIEEPIAYNNGWSYVLETVIKHSALEYGEHVGDITIKTNDESYSSFSIPVIFNKLSPIVVRSDKIILTKENEYFKGNCNVWHRDRIPIKISVIPDDRINTTIQTDHESHEYLVSFSFPASEFNANSLPQTVNLKIEPPCQMEIPVTLSLLQSY
jgi:hypothetical protein